MHEIILFWVKSNLLSILQNNSSDQISVKSLQIISSMLMMVSTTFPSLTLCCLSTFWSFFHQILIYVYTLKHTNVLPFYFLFILQSADKEALNTLKPKEAFKYLLKEYENIISRNTAVPNLYVQAITLCYDP